MHKEFRTSLVWVTKILSKSAYQCWPDFVAVSDAEEASELG